MKYINKETLEVYENPGEVRKALAPKALPKVLTRSVMDENNLAYLYSGYTPKPSLFTKFVETGVVQDNEKFLVTYEAVQIWETEEEKQNVLDATIEGLKLAKIKELRKDFDEQVDAIMVDTSESEKLSWDKQELESKAYLLDNTTPTPYIAALIASRDRGETLEEFSNKVLAKSAGYCAYHANLLGIYHNKLVEVENFEYSIATADEDITRLSSISMNTSENIEGE